MNKIIKGPDGVAIYDKETGIIIRLDHEEAALFIDGYAPINVGFVQPMAESLSRARKRHFAPLGTHN
ncbi:MAG: hypothetical protein FJZ89_06305 [Chloroflexi bacterium]|nr:hypothetical protein [Chloroflexota bacterium]